MARLSVQFPGRTTQILEEMSNKDEVSKTEIIRRALSLYKYLEEEIQREDGRKISITDKDDKILKDIVITK